MTALAAVVLSHRDPDHLRRLVAALDGIPIFLHVDRRASPEVFRQMVDRLPSRVTVLPRRRTSLSSWSLVAAELDGLRAAYQKTAAEHVMVLSGCDYPLTSVSELAAELDVWRDRSRLVLAGVPIWYWDTPRHPDGGMWRFRHRFLSRRDQVLQVAGMPLRLPWQRPVPPDLTLHASSQWKILARPHLRALFHVLDNRPDLVRFWRSTLVPDESCIASILASPALVGDLAQTACNELPWFIDWDPGADHPKWLTSAQFDRIAAARWAPPRSPDDPDLADAMNMGNGRKLIARKFSSTIDAVVVDLIDEQLRV